jgi:hypothetical protein
VDLAETLRGVRSLEDLPALASALGNEPLWDPVPGPGEPTVVVGCRGDFAWYALAGPRAEATARAFAGRMAARGRICGAIGLDPGLRRLTLTISLSGAPRLVLDLDRPAPAALAKLRRLVVSPLCGAAGFAAHAVEVLGGESVGLSFFRQFRSTLEQMAAGLPGPLTTEDRHALALLQLTRVLFLYFVQARGWLAGNGRFLPDAVDGCLARKRKVHRDLLRPLFFGTLNRPASERSRGALALGSIPFLNGGLFEPHPLERRLRRDIPNELWRDAFDGLFERFHFTLEAGERSGVAPDMLGRVFEGVMASAGRRAPTTRPPRWWGSCWTTPSSRSWPTGSAAPTPRQSAGWGTARPQPGEWCERSRCWTRRSAREPSCWARSSDSPHHCRPRVMVPPSAARCSGAISSVWTSTAPPSG